MVLSAPLASLRQQKFRRVVDTADSFSVFRSGLSKGGGTASMNFMKFDKKKRQVLLLEKNNLTVEDA